MIDNYFSRGFIRKRVDTAVDEERTGTLVTAPRKNAELNPRPDHGHRGVRRGNV